MRFDPKNGQFADSAREEEGTFTAIIASLAQSQAMAVMAASLLAVSCEELMSLASQQDFMR